MAEARFATSVSCMDGRIQTPLAGWIKENHSVDYVDAITEPGADKKVAVGICLDSIRSKVEISIKAHKSDLVAVSGHYDCAGNPVPDEEHIMQIKKSVDVISSWNLGVRGHRSVG